MYGRQNQPFMLDLNVFYRHAVAVGTQIRERLILRNPAARDLIRRFPTATVVVFLQENILAQTGRWSLGAHLRAESGSLASPVVKPLVESHPAFQRDRQIFRAARQ